MAPRSKPSLALFLALNILFTLVTSACNTCPHRPKPYPKPKPKPRPHPHPHPHPHPSPSHSSPSNPNPRPPSTPGTGTPTTPGTGTPSTPGSGTPSTPGTGTPSTPGTGTPSTPGTGTPSTPGTPGTPSGNSSSNGTCPRDALKIGICARVLGRLVNVTIGTPPVQPCCTLIQGLVDLEAAVCLCTAIQIGLLGIPINIPIALSLLLNVCGNTVPRGFQCS